MYRAVVREGKVRYELMPSYGLFLHICTDILPQSAMIAFYPTIALGMIRPSRFNMFGFEQLRHLCECLGHSLSETIIFGKLKIKHTSAIIVRAAVSAVWSYIGFMITYLVKPYETVKIYLWPSFEFGLSHPRNQYKSFRMASERLMLSVGECGYVHVFSFFHRQHAHRRPSVNLFNRIFHTIIPPMCAQQWHVVRFQDFIDEVGDFNFFAYRKRHRYFSTVQKWSE